MSRFAASLAFALVALSAPLSAAPPTSAPTSTTAPAPTPLPEIAPPEAQSPFWQQALADLSSSDFPRRQSAQQRLQSLTVEQHAAMQWHWRHTADPELQSRLDVALTELEDRTCGDTPPISLHLKNATLARTITALNQALGSDLLFPHQPSNYDRKMDDLPTFSIDMDHAPYWDVLAALTRQAPLYFPRWDKPIASPNVPEISRGGIVLQNFQRVRGAVIFANSVSLNTVAYPQATGTDANPAPRLEFGAGAYLDPRLFVVRLIKNDLTLVRDNAGHQLFPNNSPEYTWTDTPKFAYPPDIGTRVETLQGEYSWEIATRVLTTEFHNVGPGNYPVGDDGDFVIALSGFRVEYGKMSLTFRLQETNQTLPRRSKPFPTVQITLWDADGRLLSDGLSALSYSYSPPPKLPLRLRINLALRTATFRAPYNLKDIPLPK